MSPRRDQVNPVMIMFRGATTGQAGIEIMHVEEKETQVATEWIEAAIGVEELESPAGAKELHAALEPLPGVVILSMEGGEVALRYNPAETSLAEIHQEISRRGFKMGKEKSTRSSPVGDVEEHDHVSSH